ncbi:hypothetical protein [Microbacterium sp. che218]|uniref:hypothetical protein n=1 Tax=Microbacterium sp. che218 TaxID=3140649 RepID=UPI003368C4FA
MVNHPQRNRIDQMLDDGVSYRVIGTEMGLTLSSMGRYAVSRKSQLARVMDDEPNTVDIGLRLKEAADLARDLRRRVGGVGTPLAQARAIKVEMDALASLRTHVGGDDITALDVLEEAQDVVNAVVDLAKSHPKAASALADHMAERKSLRDLTKSLRTRIEKY